MGHGYVHAGDAVFWHTTPLDADPDTFRLIGEGYACDDTLVFYRWEQIR